MNDTVPNSYIMSPFPGNTKTVYPNRLLLTKKDCKGSVMGIDTLTCSEAEAFLRNNHCINWKTTELAEALTRVIYLIAESYLLKQKP